MQENYLETFYRLKNSNLVLINKLESKKNTEEQNSLYDNIMNYCAMKETKLNKYIEQISSVL